MNEPRRNNDYNRELVIDNVLSTQPELGPSIPDGGYGWVIFFATLFFQALIPSLVVSFGIYLCFTKLTDIGEEDIYPNLWDNNFLYVPLFFTASWTFGEPFIRTLIHNSTWPRLVATAATCLTCAGLLFMWMGIIRTNDSWLYVLAGIIAGVGACLQISQCEILLSQYFKLKHTTLVHITQSVTAFGFVMVPIILGNHLLNSNLMNVSIWYQTIILQGLVINLVFKKPLYLKSSQRRYKFLSMKQDDDDVDIFSKNSKELQIRRTNSTVEKVNLNNPMEAGASTSHQNGNVLNERKLNWEKFEDSEEIHNFEESDEEQTQQRNWEKFEEDEDTRPKSWVKFEDEENKTSKQKVESFLSNDKQNPKNEFTDAPIPIFSDLPINNNVSYSFEDSTEQPESLGPSVFVENSTTNQKTVSIINLHLLMVPTFYKSLLTVITTKYSTFVFYSLFPTYLYQEIGLKFRPTTHLVGFVSLNGVIFSAASYWININKKVRPISIWVFCWIGALGYIALSDSTNETLFLLGALQITISISTLQYIGRPLLGLSITGERSREFFLISVLSGLSFLFFLCFDIKLRVLFRLMAGLNFITGSVWFSNYVYKKIKEIR